MSTSFRYVIRGAYGRMPCNYNLPGAIYSSQAVVHITAGEVKPGPRTSAPRGINQDFIYKLGDATVWVGNVSPHFNSHFGGEQGGVEFILYVVAPYPIDVAVTITVEDHTPVSIQN